MNNPFRRKTLLLAKDIDRNQISKKFINLSKIRILFNDPTNGYSMNIESYAYPYNFKFGKPQEINKVSSDKAIAILAEHSRSATFLIADGVIPENVGRGYILRRLIRKAMRYGFLLNLKEEFIIELSREVINLMSDYYPELKDNEKFITEVLNNECKSFSKTLSSGEKILKQLIINRSGIQKIIESYNRNQSEDKEFINKIVESEVGHQGLISQLIEKDIETSRLLNKKDLNIYKDLRTKIINTNWNEEVSYLETSYLYDTLGFPFEVTSE